MPIITDKNQFNIPSFTFVTSYSGKSTFSAHYYKYEYRNVSVCMFAYDSIGGSVEGIFASRNISDFTALKPYDSDVPFDYTVDGKTVYWTYGLKYADGHTTTDYLDPTLNFWEPYSWYKSLGNLDPSPFKDPKELLPKVAWLMIYGESEPDDTDPYKSGGSSGTGGGTGNFDGTSENIGIPGLPSLSAVDTGFISLFNPTAGELKNLADYLWGDLFDISTWKKIFADPMDAILGLSIVPVNVPSAGSSAVTIGNISTGVNMTKASSQYVSVDCGTINVNEYWGAYLDYSPYTKAEIYLPFVGTHPVTIDDIMGKPVHVVYHVDVLSGACCAYVQCGGSVLYSFVGQCSCSIPITANDWTNVINGALSIAGSIGTMVATGGATAPMAITNMASTAVNSSKPDVEKSGSMGGMGGLLGVQKPYIILTRPRQALPARQNTFTGYPSFITKKLSECTGYTEVESIHLENVPATQNELDEITELLKSGVII